MLNGWWSVCIDKNTGKQHVHQCLQWWSSLYPRISPILWTPQWCSDGTVGPGSFSLQFQLVAPFHACAIFIRYWECSWLHQQCIRFLRSGRLCSHWAVLCQLPRLSQSVHRKPSQHYWCKLNWITPVSIVKRKLVGCFCYAAGTVEVCCWAIAFRILRCEWRCIATYHQCSKLQCKSDSHEV